MGRRFLLAAAALPITMAAVIVASAAAPGCGSGEPVDDVCGWIKDPANCYRTLHDETGTRCGAAFDAGVDVASSEPTGKFLQRDALDVCVLDAGGQVKFDQLPPLDQFPVTSLAFTRLDVLSEPCLTVSYTDDVNMTLTFYPCTAYEVNQDIPACDDAFGADASVTAVDGGTFSVASEEGRDIFNVTCPAGSEGVVKTYRFNLNETSKCEGYTQFFPHAEIDSNPGKALPPWETNSGAYSGWVRFRLFYPPSGQEDDIEGDPPDILQYFNCTIPPQDPCTDGIQDFFETDVDCGGPMAGQSVPEVSMCARMQRSCERCEIGQICKCHNDCKGGNCALDTLSGFFKCAEGGPDPNELCPGATGEPDGGIGAGGGDGTDGGCGGSGGGGEAGGG